MNSLVYVTSNKNVSYKAESSVISADVFFLFSFANSKY